MGVVFNACTICYHLFTLFETSHTATVTLLLSGKMCPLVNETNSTSERNHYVFVELARTIYIYIYIWCVYGIFGREINEYTVIYGVYIYGSGQPYVFATQ